MSGDTQARPSRIGWALGDRLPDHVRAALLGPGAPFEITSATLHGFDRDVFARRPRSLRAAFDATVARQPGAEMILAPERTWTYTEFVADVEAVSRRLVERYGIRPGDRVGIIAANSPEYAVVMWATLSVGAIVTSLNGWWNGPEIAQGIALTEPSVIIGDERRLARIEPGMVADGVPVVLLDELVDSARADGADGRSWAVEADEESPAVILFTSGTTGRAKGAILSHANIIHFAMSNMLGGAIGAMLAPPAADAAGGQAAAPPRPTSIVASPMFHVSGLVAALQTGPLLGVRLVFPKPGRWDVTEFLELTHRCRVTMWSGVPTQWWRILRHERIDDYDLSCVTTAGGGGATFPPELIRALSARLPQAMLGNGYGMSETAGMGTRIGTPQIVEFPDSVGGANPTVTIEIRDDDGHVVPEGEIGEIYLQSASVFRGYWNNPEATAESIVDGGWYRSGDFGRVSGGLLYLESRRRDLILRGGENIYPIEIENCLIEHPSIDDAAVIGVPDDELGQVVKAFVVLAAGADLDAAGVQAWVADRLARFKVPSHVEFRTSLPYTESGKVQKHVLEQESGVTG